MKYRILTGATLAALSLLAASSAFATPCGSTTTYASPTVCSVGPLTFENFSSSVSISQGNGNDDAATITAGNGEIAGTLSISQGSGISDTATIETGSNNISPFTSGGEFGLAFPTTPALYSISDPSDTGTASVDFSFEVISAVPIDDAFLSFGTDLTPGTNGSATASVTETLNGVPVTLGAPGSTTTYFTPVTELVVDIHETDSQSGPSTVTFDGLTGAFSVVPEPTTLSLLGLSLFGVGFLRRRKGD